jgi:predicted Zn-dependent peptidase
MAWPGPRLDHADVPAIELLVGILGRNRTGRLTRSLRERLGVVDAISMGYAALEGAGIVTLVAQVDREKVDDAERAVLAELRHVRSEGVTDVERRRAVTATEARREFESETTEGRAYALGRAETLWRVAEELAYVDRVRSVTTEQVKVAARRYLDPERFARVTLGPASP